MADVEIRRFGAGDEVRTFEHGTFEVVTLGGVTVGRASCEPGWGVTRTSSRRGTTRG